MLRMKLDGKVRALVYNHRGMAWFSLNDHRRAIRDFNQAIRFDPTNDRNFTNRGLCHRVMKRFDKALADYETALEIDPVNPESSFGRAQTYFDMGQYALAKKDCKKLLEITPGFAPARELLREIDSK